MKAEYQDVDEAGSITNVEYKDTLDGSVDVRFDFLCSRVVIRRDGVS